MHRQAVPELSALRQGWPRAMDVVRLGRFLTRCPRIQCGVIRHLDNGMLVRRHARQAMTDAAALRRVLAHQHENFRQHLSRAIAPRDLETTTVVVTASLPARARLGGMDEQPRTVSTRSVWIVRLTRAPLSMRATRRVSDVIVYRHRVSGILERHREWRVLHHSRTPRVDAKRASIVRIAGRSHPTSSTMTVGDPVSVRCLIDRVDLHKTCGMREECPVRAMGRAQAGRTRTEATGSRRHATMLGHLATMPGHLAETWGHRQTTSATVGVMGHAMNRLRSETHRSLIVITDHRGEWTSDVGAAAALAVAALDQCRSTAAVVVALELHRCLRDVPYVLTTDRSSVRARRDLMVLPPAVTSSLSASVRCSRRPSGIVARTETEEG